jgi:microcystin degradation protein MlrC
VSANQTPGTLRLAFGRINQETNALSPVKTTLADFKNTHYFEGAPLLAGCQKGVFEVPGMFKNAELSGFVQQAQQLPRIELVPLLSAWAVPSGPLTNDCFMALTRALAESVRAAGPLDGVYLALHGAMGVDGVVEPEGEIVRAVREVVGDQIPVVVTLDLHGNVTRDFMQRCTAVLAYATNPHRDHRSLGARAARILVDTCRGAAKPTMAWRSLPMLLGGGTTLDFWPPLLQIFRRMRALEKSGDVLSASLLTVHPWNAHPELGWAVVVVTNGDQAKAERIADELAERAWGTRHQLPPAFVSAHEAIRQARAASLRRKLGVVVLADASDVVSAGAPGENTALLRTLLDEGQGLLSYVPLRDPAVIAELWDKPKGASVTVTLGGKLDRERSQPLTLNATLENKTQAHGVDRMVVLAVGTIRIVVVEGPALAIRPSFFALAGLSVWKADVIVVKNFFPFRMFFLPMARKTLYVRTQGVTDFDAAFVLDFAGPVHPRDPVNDWRDADRRRRAA